MGCSKIKLGPSWNWGIVALKWSKGRPEIESHFYSSPHLWEVRVAPSLKAYQDANMLKYWIIPLSLLKSCQLGYCWLYKYKDISTHLFLVSNFQWYSKKWRTNRINWIVQFDDKYTQENDTELMPLICCK